MLGFCLQSYWDSINQCDKNYNIANISVSLVSSYLKFHQLSFLSGIVHLLDSLTITLPYLSFSCLGPFHLRPPIRIHLFTALYIFMFSLPNPSMSAYRIFSNMSKSTNFPALISDPKINFHTTSRIRVFLEVHKRL